MSNRTLAFLKPDSDDKAAIEGTYFYASLMVVANLV